VRKEQERARQHIGLSRREFLANTCRISLLGILASLGGLEAASCALSGAPSIDGRQPPGAVPQLPVNSPDFDLVNTLLQLEHRAAALASETRVGRRLGVKTSGVVDRIFDSHRAHIAVLERVVRDAGATPDPPRDRYTLPTPLGDERRALAVLLEDEANLVSKYAAGLRDLQTVRLARSLSSLLFSCKTHVAAVDRLLDRCTDPSFVFEDIAGQIGRPPSAPRVSAAPSGAGILIAPSAVLQALASFEATTAKVCAVAAQKIYGALQALIHRGAGVSRQVTPAPTPLSTKLEAVGYCVLSKDAEGRIRGPASAELPDAVSILDGSGDVGDDAKGLVSATVSLLEAMAAGHEQRAGFWAAQAAMQDQSQGAVVATSPPLDVAKMPEELSPTAAGVSQEQLAPAPPGGEIPPSQVFQTVVDSELKTATAIAVAASNLGSEALRSKAGDALAAVATATSRLVGIATGGEFVVSEV